FSVSSWLIAARLPGAEKPRLHRIEGGDMAALLAFFAELRSRVLGRARRECRRGVLLRGRSRWVLAAPITDGAWRRDPVLEPTSILVNRRARRAKTDGSTRGPCCACSPVATGSVQHGARAHADEEDAKW